MHIAPITLARHHRRRRVLAALPVLTASAVLVAACSSDTPTSEPSTVTVTTLVPTIAATTATPTTATPSGPYRSALYGYVVTSLDWTGISATTAWDGTGGPGNDEPVVDLLYGPAPQQAFAFGVPTTATLDEYVAAQRAVKEPDHPCPDAPEASASITVAGKAAVLDEMHCPADASGVFVLQAFVVHDGWANNFVTYAPSGKETEMRAWFGAFLQTISFDA
jgi:hypothetical protein